MFIRVPSVKERLLNVFSSGSPKIYLWVDWWKLGLHVNRYGCMDVRLIILSKCRVKVWVWVSVGSGMQGIPWYIWR